MTNAGGGIRPGIGGATGLAADCTELMMMQIEGRWSSDTFITYVKVKWSTRGGRRDRCYGDAPKRENK